MPTLVTARHAGERRVFNVSLDGHDARRHMNEILGTWLRLTADPQEENGDDDPNTWTPGRFHYYTSGRIMMQFMPYRGEDVKFYFTPPGA